MVPGWNIYSNNSDTSDINGHGTAVAGTAAAATNNGVGVASVAWDCRIMPIRISDSTGMATVSDIASGLLIWNLGKAMNRQLTPVAKSFD